MNITASDRSVLLRLASSLPKGDEVRRAILSSLKRASPETDAFWKNFGALEGLSYYSGKAVAFLMGEKIAPGEKAWLEGTANRAHAQRAKICRVLQKDFKDDPEVAPIVPLLKLCQAAASTMAKAQTWSPAYDGVLLENAVKKLLPLYIRARSTYPTAAHLLEIPE